MLIRANYKALKSIEGLQVFCIDEQEKAVVGKPLELELHAFTFSTRQLIKDLSHCQFHGTRYARPRGKLLLIDGHNDNYLYQLRFESYFESVNFFINYLGKLSTEEIYRIYFEGMQFPEYDGLALMDDFLKTCSGHSLSEIEFHQLLESVQEKYDWDFVGIRHTDSQVPLAANVLIEPILSLSGSHISDVYAGINSSSEKNRSRLKILAGVLSFYLDRETMKQMAESRQMISDKLARKHVMIGKSHLINELRSKIPNHYKSLASVLISGPRGCGKSLMARILADENQLENKTIEIVECDPSINENVKDLLQEIIRAQTNATGPQIVVLKHVQYLEAGYLKQFLKQALLGSIKVIGTFANEPSDVLNNIFEDHFRMPSLELIKTDIPFIASYLLNQICEKRKIPRKGLSLRFNEVLSAYNWPGNVDELKFFLSNLIDRHLYETFVDYNPSNPAHLPDRRKRQKDRFRRELEYRLSRGEDLQVIAESILGQIKSA